MNRAIQRSMKHHEICPLDTTLEILSGKWKSVILCRLMAKNLHFNELHRFMSMCSKRMLAIQLKQLVSDDIVKKNILITNESQITIIYSLTSLGESLVPIIRQMDTWGEKYIKIENQN
ncbi:winged helix-turn-helix transcriptional regulator [Leuconostoc sp. MS02]|uniref:Winged helix-turn-helix transcriptional regulator n=1 Tax=Leuconostoc aquikimchii TaxID=3236804 RepID=A0ABV3S588_9LACO